MRNIRVLSYQMVSMLPTSRVLSPDNTNFIYHWFVASVLLCNILVSSGDDTLQVGCFTLLNRHKNHPNQCYQHKQISDKMDKSRNHPIVRNPTRQSQKIIEIVIAVNPKKGFVGWQMQPLMGCRYVPSGILKRKTYEEKCKKCPVSLSPLPVVP